MCKQASLALLCVCVRVAFSIIFHIFLSFVYVKRNFVGLEAESWVCREMRFSFWIT